MKAYKVLFQGTPNHVGLLVEVEENVNNLYHAIGDPIHGFEFDIKRDYDYEDSLTYLKNSLTYIKDVDLSVEELEDILRSVPVQGPIDFRKVQKLRRGIDYGDCRTWFADALTII